MKNVMIDTSAWVDFFRNRNSQTGDMVAELIQTDKAFITGPVIAELLHGVRGKKETNQLDVLFDTIPCMDVEHTDWVNTGKKLQALQKRGLTVPLTDALIASIAMRLDMAVLTLDKHFLYLSVNCLGLE